MFEVRASKGSCTNFFCGTYNITGFKVKNIRSQFLYVTTFVGIKYTKTLFILFEKQAKFL